MIKILGLEQKTAIEILFFLDIHEKVINKELTNGVSGDYRTIKRAMDNLINLELIGNEYRKGQPTRRFIWITDKGKKVVSLLKEIEKLLHA